MASTASGKASRRNLLRSIDSGRASPGLGSQQQDGDARIRAALINGDQGPRPRICPKADALEIEAAAKRRLADEYDAAQARGEVAGQGKPSKREGLAKVNEIGLTHKQIHEARQIRDAEARDPGIVRRAVDAAVKAGKEPTKRRASKRAAWARPA